MVGSVSETGGAAIAGKPRSHRDFWCSQNLWPAEIHCGSGLAREGGLTVTADVKADRVIMPAPYRLDRQP